MGECLLPFIGNVLECDCDHGVMWIATKHEELSGCRTLVSPKVLNSKTRDFGLVFLIRGLLLARGVLYVRIVAVRHFSSACQSEFRAQLQTKDPYQWLGLKFFAEGSLAALRAADLKGGAYSVTKPATSSRIF